MQTEEIARFGLEPQVKKPGSERKATCAAPCYKRNSPSPLTEKDNKIGVAGCREEKAAGGLLPVLQIADNSLGFERMNRRGGYNCHHRRSKQAVFPLSEQTYANEFAGEKGC